MSERIGITPIMVYDVHRQKAHVEIGPMSVGSDICWHCHGMLRRNDRVAIVTFPDTLPDAHAEYHFACLPRKFLQ